MRHRKSSTNLTGRERRERLALCLGFSRTGGQDAPADLLQYAQRSIVRGGSYGLTGNYELVMRCRQLVREEMWETYGEDAEESEESEDEVGRRRSRSGRRRLSGLRSGTSIIRGRAGVRLCLLCGREEEGGRRKRRRSKGEGMTLLKRCGAQNASPEFER
ncbi:hypothetical protein BT69DRAFT_752891 [Atractiella rhizophila]|nr:hypothetical protein BT69DRAFT_752891 [Atractiella rhizophila]